MAKASERLAWAVDVLGVRPDDRLLEIGCGHGVAVSLVCERLDTGHIHALDRSAKMIAAAEKRNAACVAAGRASFQTAELADAELRSDRYDKVFGIHIGVFLRGDPRRELETVAAHLAPGGRLYLAFQPFTAEQFEPTAERLTEVLGAHGFGVEDVVVGAGGLCVVAQPG